MKERDVIALADTENLSKLTVSAFRFALAFDHCSRKITHSVAFFSTA